MKPQPRWTIFARICLLALAGGLAAPRPGGSLPQLETAAVAVGNTRQLFIDDRIVERMQGAARVLNRPKKYEGNPVIRPEKRWEGNFLSASSVIYDQEDAKFKMWYSTRLITAQRPERPIEEYESLLRASNYKEELNHSCLATSQDGIHWDRPELDLVDFDGSRKNNLLAGKDWNSLFKDTREKNPSRRYKAAGYWSKDKNGNFGVGVYFSADGLHSTAYERNPVVSGTSDVHTLLGWDERIQKYVGYFRPGWSKSQADFERLSPPAGKLRVRTIGYSVSDDFEHWSPIEPALRPDEQDPIDAQFYGMPVVQYAGYYIGLPWLFRTNALTMEPVFAFSRDGKKFQRLQDRSPFLPLGANGTWDDACVYVGRPIVRGDTILFYYTGVNFLHGAEDLLVEGKKAGAAIGLATLPLDGFVSLDAGPNPGTITTRPLTFKGKRLVVNFEDSQKGSAGVDDASSLRVEVLDQSGNPLPGLGLEESVPVNRTGPRQPASWKGKADLSAFAGQTVRLRFHLRNGKFYSFQFMD